MHLIELAVYRSRPSYVQKVFRSLNLISSGTSNLTLRFPCTGRITSVVIVSSATKLLCSKPVLHKRWSGTATHDSNTHGFFRI